MSTFVSLPIVTIFPKITAIIANNCTAVKVVIIGIRSWKFLMYNKIITTEQARFSAEIIDIKYSN